MADDSKNILAALSYVLWPVALIILIVEETKHKQKDKYLRHHAINALGFFVGALILSIPLWVLGWIPVLGTILNVLFWVAIIVLAVVFAMRAYRKEEVVVPYTTDFLRRNVKGF